MDKSERIYIAPKPCRLPRQSFNERTIQQKLRVLAFWLLVGAVFWGGIYLMAKR